MKDRAERGTRNVVAILPIKAHSERCPGKNFLDLGGRPLWRWIPRGSWASPTSHNSLSTRTIQSVSRANNDRGATLWYYSPGGRNISRGTMFT